MALVRCTCEHDFQDRRYGDQIRIMNPCKPGSDGKKKRGKSYTSYRCTVCGREV